MSNEQSDNVVLERSNLQIDIKRGESPTDECQLTIEYTAPEGNKIHETLASLEETRVIYRNGDYVGWCQVVYRIEERLGKEFLSSVTHIWTEFLWEHSLRNGDDSEDE